ncbi:TlpA family protein disulfide reductase [Urbifossiella limnaea]|uniref:Thiol-disulfide oxidoreductase ResA n=1 Tax=Urbifossiella limnaea TaxID=2528023 RepID=A0A517XZS3_9BACT|nr:TlpA disulfide reductase family protein [Urbifossiella limnaea]QDU23011.1 Thiol-disulfide oxidoreductase ResA [Urbifossiella limnaea]
MRSAIILAVLAGLAVGCGGSPAPSSGSGTPPTRRFDRGNFAPPPVELNEVSADELVSVVTGQKDKVVVVDFWATWCGPCVKKFPHLVAMHKKHAAAGLVCVSVDMGKLGTHDRAAALEFLTKQGATFPNVTLRNPADDSPAMDKTFGEDTRLLPYLVIFDRGGRRVWDSAANPDATPEQVEAKVAELLKK